MSDFYSFLGVEKSASHAEIKAAFRKLASKFHPDKETGDKEAFQNVQKAYATLGDEEKRKRYDEGMDELPDTLSEETLIQVELLKHFELFLQHCDPDFADPLELITEALRAEAKEIPKQQAAAGVRAGKIKQLLKRLTKKSKDAESPILLTLRNRQLSMEAQIPLMAERIVFLKKCEDALKDFLYELPKSRQAATREDFMTDLFVNSPKIAQGRNTSFKWGDF